MILTFELKKSRTLFRLGHMHYNSKAHAAKDSTLLFYKKERTNAVSAAVAEILQQNELELFL